MMAGSPCRGTCDWGIGRALVHAALCHTRASSKGGPSTGHVQTLPCASLGQSIQLARAALVGPTVQLARAIVASAGTPTLVIDEDVALMDAGMDSALLTEFADALGREVGKRLPATLLLECGSIRAAAEQLCGPTAAPLHVQRSQSAMTMLRVRMRALSLVLPGGVASSDAAWSTFAAGASVVESSTSPDIDEQLGVQPEQIQRLLRHGGFVSCISLFDNVRFRVSPSESRAMDPQQRLLLEHGDTAFTCSALEQPLNRNLVGAFVGMSALDFEDAVNLQPNTGCVYASTGGKLSVASGSVVYFHSKDLSCTCLAMSA